MMAAMYWKPATGQAVWQVLISPDSDSQNLWGTATLPTLEVKLGYLSSK